MSNPLADITALQHAHFDFDGVTYALGNLPGLGWTLHANKTPIAQIIQTEAGAFLVMGVNDAEADHEFSDLPNALTHATTRH